MCHTLYLMQSRWLINVNFLHERCISLCTQPRSFWVNHSPRKLSLTKTILFWCARQLWWWLSFEWLDWMILKTKSPGNLILYRVLSWSVNSCIFEKGPGETICANLSPYIEDKWGLICGRYWPGTNPPLRVPPDSRALGFLVIQAT